MKLLMFLKPLAAARGLGNPRRDVATILEEIEITPGFLPGIMDLTHSFNTKVSERRPFCEVNLDMEFHALHLRRLGSTIYANIAEIIYVYP